MRHEPAPDLASTVERARAGDHVAIRAMIELYQGRVGRFVRSMLGDDSRLGRRRADDLRQDDAGN